MKKSSILAAALGLCLLAVPAASQVEAAEQPAFVVESVSGSEGDSVTVDIAVANNGDPGFCAARISVGYDSSVLELESIENGTVLTGGLYQAGDPSNNPCKVLWSLLTNSTENGTLATATFTIKDGAQPGTYPITVTYEPNDVFWDKGNGDFENVAFTVENGAVEVVCQHEAGEWTIVADPTCTEPGEQVLTCRKCGTTMETQKIPALGHTYGAWVVDQAATCTEDGAEHRVCSVCGYVEEAVIPAAHTFGEWKTVTKPTCTEEGEQQRTCSVCGYVEESVISAAGHVWEADFTVDKEATETEEGQKSIHCQNCDAVKDVTVIPALGVPVETTEAQETTGAAETTEAQETTEAVETTAAAETTAAETEGAAQESDSNIPKTGDTSTLMVMAVICAAAGVALVGVLVYKKRFTR